MSLLVSSTMCSSSGGRNCIIQHLVSSVGGRPVHKLRESSLNLHFRPDPARKLSANLYDIYHCCVYSEKLLMVDRGTARNM